MALIFPTLINALLGLVLLAPVETLTQEQRLLQGQLEVMPFPVLMPAALPEGFELSDVRLHTQAHAQAGLVHSYTLVFASQEQSFMLQSRPDGYRTAPGRCPGRVLHSSRPFLATDFAMVPQTLELLSPACSLSGDPLGSTVTAEQSAPAWQSLGWYLPPAWRPRPPRLPEIN